MPPPTAPQVIGQGGTDTLLVHPAAVSHGACPKARIRPPSGWTAIGASRYDPTVHARPHLVPALPILVVLAAFWTRTPVQPLASYDQPFYLGIAYDLLHHHRFTDGYRFAGGGADDAPSRAGRPPGMRFTPLYPTLLAGAALLDPPFRRGLDCLVAHGTAPGACGHEAVAMRTLQFLMLACVYWMLWWSGWRCSGRPGTGWLALGLALAAAPWLLRPVNMLMTETVSLFLFVLASTLALAAQGPSRPMARRWLRFGAGLAIGLAALTRPAFGWLGAALLGGGALWTIAGGGVRRGGTVGAMAAGALLVVMPWIVRNAVVLHRASLTFGYASHTLVQRLAFDGMTWREYGMSLVCWLPDGTGIGRAVAGARACDRFGWDRPDSFYAIGIGPMLAHSLHEAGGWTRHMAFLRQTYLLHDPLRQLSWHAMVTLPLALRGLYLDHYWGLLLAPVCLAVTVRALVRREGPDRGFLLLSLPAWFLLLFDAAVAVNQVRYNLPLMLPFSIAGAIAIEAAAARFGRLRLGPLQPRLGAGPLTVASGRG